MTVSILPLANGQTDYVARHNANYNAIKTAVDALQVLLSSTITSVSGPGGAFTGMFGATATLIGVASYVSTGASTDLTVTSGFAWIPSLNTVVNKGTSTVLSFSGQPADTYYVGLDSTGTPLRNTVSTEAVYSVVWTGSAFGTITRVAPVFWNVVDMVAALTSTALGITYETLDARLEAGETKAVAGELSRIWQTGRLSKSVAGGTDVTLTAEEANNLILNFTGTLTGNINVIVPLGNNPRAWIATNNTSGAFSLTVKGTTGTGVAVTQTGYSLLYQDGTNVKSISGSGSGSGDVVGPGSSTDGRVARFDGTTGKLLKDSGAVVAGDFGTQTAKTALMGPTSGSAAVPTFRALAAADLPVASEIVTVTYGATTTVDLAGHANGTIFRITLTGNVVIELSNGTDGQKFIIELIQDGTGSRTVSLSATYFRFGTDITSFTATTTASKTDRVGCIYVSAATKADVVATIKGF